MSKRTPAIMESIKVGPYRLRVVFEQDVRDEHDKRMAAQCRHMDGIIAIDETMSPSRKFEAFVHELVHAIEDAWDAKMTEKQVSRFAVGLATVLLDNGYVEPPADDRAEAKP